MTLNLKVFRCLAQKGFGEISRVQPLAERAECNCWMSVQVGCKDIPDTHNHINIFYGTFGSCWQTYLFETFFRAWIKEIEKATDFHFLEQNSANTLANTEFPMLCLVHCAFILSVKGIYHFCINTQVFTELPSLLIYHILLWKETGMSVSISLPLCFLNLSFKVKILQGIN